MKPIYRTLKIGEKIIPKECQVKWQGGWYPASGFEFHSNVVDHTMREIRTKITSEYAIVSQWKEKNKEEIKKEIEDFKWKIKVLEKLLKK